MARTSTAFRVVLLAGMILTHLPPCNAQSTNPRARYKFFITGAVNSPGVYQIEDAPSLLRLLAMAGGLAANHGSSAFVIRLVKAESADNRPEYTVHQVNIDEVLRGNLDKDEILKPGDIVNIPAVAAFFISGDSIRSGSYPFKEGMTLLQALATANVLTHGSSGKKAVIVRKDPSTGQRLEIDVDLDALTSGKEKDIPLLPNDVIMISGSRTRSVQRFFDVPPKQMSNPCHGSSPCIARLD